MRKMNAQRAQILQTSSVPAPIGGLNSRDSIAAMPPTDAIMMVNWFPTPTTIDVRGGSLDWGTGMTGWVETIMVYNGSTNTKMFAVAGTVLYDVTLQGVAVANPLNNIGSARWSYINFGTPGGQFLVACDGVGRTKVYDGNGWSNVFNAATGFNSITSITNSGTTATLTTGSAHGYSTGQQVTVSGATPAAYNGTYNITVTGTNTFTYVMATTPGGNATVVGSLSQPAITGSTGTQNFNYVTSFKSRLFFIEKNTLHVWYLPVTQIFGAASLLDLSSIFKLGGKLVAAQAWNIDTVAGPNDYIAFLSDRGEVVVYQGYDPTQASTWSLQGVFRVGRPAGPRALQKIGSDLYVVTVDGCVPLSKAMLTDRSQGEYQVSAKIDNLINNDVSTYANNFGWQLTLYPVGNKIIVNVPQVENSIQYQYVCNTITGAWTVFKGWSAACFELMNDRLFFGTNGKVVQCDVGTVDNGIAIQTDLKPAFSAFGAPGQNKQFTMVRPIFSTSGAFGTAAVLNVDFRDATPTSSLNLPSSANASLWDVSLWDVSYWSQDNVVNINWETVYGIGFQASYRLQTISKISVSLLAIDYGYQMGGVL
jgi:hypothetical protein